MPQVRCVGVMTLYYPDQSHVGNVERIARECNLLILCDNSPEEHASLFADIQDISYHFNGKNEGLSAAFNRVLRNGGYDWQDNDFVLFFDQDTEIPAGHIAKLKREYEKLERCGESVGCLGPVYYNVNSGEEEIPHRRCFVNSNTMRVESIITTSMMTRYRNLCQIGFWDERIFLDYADWALCWRMKAAGHNCYMTRVSIIRHTVGEQRIKVGPLRLYIGKPFREYYQIRDALYLSQQNLVPRMEKIRFAMRVLLRPLFYLMTVKKDGFSRFRFYAMAIKDAVRRK